MNNEISPLDRQSENTFLREEAFSKDDHLNSLPVFKVFFGGYTKKI